MLYRTTQKELGEFYGKASGVLITPDKKQMRSASFTQTFETSGMYRDSSLQSPFIQKMRRKYHREYVRKRALDKEAFELRQKVAIEEKKENIFNVIDKDTIIFTKNLHLLLSNINSDFEKRSLC